MSGHRSRGQPEHEFDETVFEPQSTFDFDEDITDLDRNMANFQAFPGDNLDFDLMNGVYGDADFEQELFDGRPHQNGGAMSFGNSLRTFTGQGNAPSKAQLQGNHPFGTRPKMPEPQSAQSDLVNSRRQNASYQYGQVTPPEDATSDSIKVAPSRQSQSQSQQARAQESSKLSNEQRARNAANTRHSRSKNARKKVESERDMSDGEAGAKQGKNITLQREKNRVAAAKCRAKKKSANEQQEEMANDYSNTNNYLTREIRELKNQKTELQNFLLAHRPGVCECHGIHDYNLGQAQRLVLNARLHAMEPISSPSQESDFSTPSAVSEPLGGGMFPTHNRVNGSDMPKMPGRNSTFSGPMSYPLGQGVEPGSMQAGMTAGKDGQYMSQEFAEFLQSSPGARAGFS